LRLDGLDEIFRDFNGDFPKLVELGEGKVVVGRIFEFDVELQIVHKAGFGEIA
jgi:hypothetical protein